MAPYSDDDPYLDEASGVLKNKLGIAEQEELDQAEAALVAPIFRQLAKEQRLSGLEPTAFSSRAAHYMGELNALHPFREGNGRTQRELINQLAQDNSYYIAWDQVKEAEMLQSSVSSFHGDTSQLSSLIEQNLHLLNLDRYDFPPRATMGAFRHVC